MFRVFFSVRRVVGEAFHLLRFKALDFSGFVSIAHLSSRSLSCRVVTDAFLLPAPHVLRSLLFITSCSCIMTPFSYLVQRAAFRKQVARSADSAQESSCLCFTEADGLHRVLHRHENAVAAHAAEARPFVMEPPQAAASRVTIIMMTKQIQNTTEISCEINTKHN